MTSEPPGPEAGGTDTYAGVVTRGIALTLDALIIDAAALAVTGAVLLVTSVFSVSGKNHHTVWIVISSGLFVIWVISYFAVFWTTTGQTLGNRVMRIQVTRANGTRLKPRHALVRLVGMVISLPLFWGYVPVLISRRRRGVFDVMAGTIVTTVMPAPVMTHRFAPLQPTGNEYGAISGRDRRLDHSALLGNGVNREGAVDRGNAVLDAAQAGSERRVARVEPGSIVADLEM